MKISIMMLVFFFNFIFDISDIIKDKLKHIIAFTFKQGSSKV